MDKIARRPCTIRRPRIHMPNGPSIHRRPVMGRGELHIVQSARPFGPAESNHHHNHHHNRAHITVVLAIAITNRGTLTAILSAVERIV